MRVFVGILVVLFAMILALAFFAPSADRREANNGGGEVRFNSASSVAIYNDNLHLLREETTAECSAIIDDGYAIIAVVPISDKETRYTKTNGVWIFYQYVGGPVLKQKSNED